MKRKIHAVVTLELEKINFQIIESFGDRIFPIFSNSCDINYKLQNFLSESINQVEKKLGFYIKEVIFVIETAKNIKLELKKRTKQIEINGTIKKDHIEKTLEFGNKSASIENQIAILSRPYKYEITTEDNKIEIFDEVPLGKKAVSLKTYSIMSFIGKKIYDYIKNNCKNANVSLKSIITETHLNQYLLSNNNLLAKKEIILINIKSKSSTINIYKNNVLVDYFILNFGVSSIEAEILKNHESITAEEAKKIFQIYPNFSEFNKSTQLIVNSRLTLKNLNHYTLSFYEKLFNEIVKKIDLSKKEKIFLSGEGISIKGLENLLNNNIGTKCIINNFSTYQFLGESKTSYMAAKYIGSMMNFDIENTILITKPLKILDSFDFVSNTSENYLIS